MRGLGYLVDPEDERDRPLRLLIGHLADSPPPPSADVSHPAVFARDQGLTNSCTGQAWAQAVRLSMLTHGRRCPELSALFSYFTGRAEWNGHTGGDFGSYLRSGAAAAVRFGIAAETAWPFAAELVSRQPPIGAFRSAHDLRGARGYYRLPSGEPNAVRRALAEGHPVVGGWQVGPRFVDNVGAVVEPEVESIGGHAVVLVGYDADGTFRLLNSWGRAWGRGGFALASEAWVATGVDLWVVDAKGGP